MATKTATKKTTKKAPAKRTAKATAKAKPAKAPVKKMSQIEAAEKILGEAKEPMNCKAMVEAMAKRKLWSSPNGKTPEATLYAAILREIRDKGKESRFAKVDRGLFTVNGR